MASISTRSSRSSHTPEQSRTYCFNGTSRTLIKWTAHNKDANLWLDNGDCLVQLTPNSPYALKVPVAPLRATRNGSLLALCRPQAQSSKLSLQIPPSTSYSELVLPYELTTRNYFAFLNNRALISTRLGPAIIELWDRIQEWHPRDQQIVLRYKTYLKEQGYLHAANNPHAACASLAFADHAQQRDVWINAFTHCVAMYTRLDAHNPEYSSLSNTTKALITRAALEMENRISLFTSAVGSFLDNDFGASNLGLTKAARDHLDRFRSFLQSFFVEKLEYFPPSITADHFNLSSWDEVRDDFQSLYNYLVDRETEQDIMGDRGVTGGVCVHQNVQAFDNRHSFTALPHPLPLLPSLAPVRRMTESQVSLRNLKLIRLESDFRPSAQESLSKASNSDDVDLLERPIVLEFIVFERQKLQEKLSLAEARKVQWLLIYGCLQMLRNILLPPAGVEHAGECVYPLCVDTSACPISEEVSQPASEVTTGSLHLEIPQDDDDADRISIHPDCEADNAQDFLSLSRKGSQLESMLSDTEYSRASYSVPSSPISRTLSIRSVTALSKSVVGGLSRRNSFRKSLTQVPRKMPSLCDIVPESVEATEAAIDATPMDQDLADFDFGLEMPVRRDIVVQPELYDQQYSSHAPYTSDAENDEALSPSTDTSPRSSAYMSECETPATEPSSRSNSTRESKSMGNLARLEEEDIGNDEEDYFQPQHIPPSASLNAGCYTPSGVGTVTYDVPMSKYASSNKHVYERRSQTAAPIFAMSQRSAVAEGILSSHIGAQRRGR